MGSKISLKDVPPLKGEALIDYAKVAIAICNKKIKTEGNRKEPWIKLKEVWQEELKTAKKNN